MKKNLVLLALGALTFVSCQTQPKEDYSWIKKEFQQPWHGPAGF